MYLCFYLVASVMNLSVEFLLFGFVVAGVMVKHMMMTIITLIMRNLTLKEMTTMVPSVSMKLIVSMGRM